MLWSKVNGKGQRSPHKNWNTGVSKTTTTLLHKSIAEDGIETTTTTTLLHKSIAEDGTAEDGPSQSPLLPGGKDSRRQPFFGPAASLEAPASREMRAAGGTDAQQASDNGRGDQWPVTSDQRSPQGVL